MGSAVVNGLLPWGARWPFCEVDGLGTAFELELRGLELLRERDFFKPPRKFIFDDDRLSRISGR